MFRFLKSHMLMTFLTYGGAALLLVAACWVAYQYADPLPPRTVTIATGGESGAYYKYATKYAEYFAEQGYELKIIKTNGSMDNLAQVSGENPKVDAAMIQGGVADAEDYPNLLSLGSVYYEPLWVFHRGGADLDRIMDLKGKRLAIGTEGSGTRHVVSTLLTENGINEDNSELLDMGTGEAVSAIIKGDIDAIFLFSGANSQAVQTLSQQTDLHLLSFHRAEAYARTHHYLTPLTLPQGALNLAKDLPDRDITMLAPTANLVINKDLHPAISYLFMLAARKSHLSGDIFAGPGQFPNDKTVIFPLSDEAESFYTNGPPLLMRYLPFQAAITAERLKILLIPLLTLLFPLFKVTPPLYRWQIRRRIFKWYKHLKKMDLQARKITTKEEAMEMVEHLDELDEMVLNTSVPLSYTDYVYSLRMHIHMIQNKLKREILGEN